MNPIDLLLVEDSPTDVLLAREALESAKVLHSLTVVGDGVEALDYLYGRGVHAGAKHPDLILLDLNLPRKSGLEVLAELKADPVLMLIPVVVLTTSKAEEDLVRAYGLHANCYIIKPMDFDQFTRVVQSIQQFWFTIVTLPSV